MLAGLLGMVERVFGPVEKILGAVVVVVGPEMRVEVEVGLAKGFWGG